MEQNADWHVSRAWELLRKLLRSDELEYRSKAAAYDVESIEHHLEAALNAPAMSLEKAETAIGWLIDNEAISVVITEDDTADVIVCSPVFQVVRNGEQLDVWATLSFDDLCEGFEALARKKP